jgi:hypothetical protein
MLSHGREEKDKCNNSTRHINQHLRSKAEKILFEIDQVFDLCKEFHWTRALIISGLAGLTSLVGWLGLTNATKRFDIPLLLAEIEGFFLLPLAVGLPNLIKKGEFLSAAGIGYSAYTIHNQISNAYGSRPDAAHTAGMLSFFAFCSLLILYVELMKKSNCYERVREFSSEEEQQILSVFSQAWIDLPEEKTKDPKNYIHQLLELKNEREKIAGILHKNALLKNSIFSALPQMPSDPKEIVLDYECDDPALRGVINKWERSLAFDL